MRAVWSITVTVWFISFIKTDISWKTRLNVVNYWNTILTIRLILENSPALACSRTPVLFRVRNIRPMYQGMAMVISVSLNDTSAWPSKCRGAGITAERRWSDNGFDDIQTKQSCSINKHTQRFDIPQIITIIHRQRNVSQSSWRFLNQEGETFLHTSFLRANILLSVCEGWTYGNNSNIS